MKMNKFAKDFILFFAENNGDGSKSALIKMNFNRFHITKGCPVDCTKQDAPEILHERRFLRTFLW